VYIALGTTRYVAVVNFVRFLSLYTLVPALFYPRRHASRVLGRRPPRVAMVPFIYYFNAKLGLVDLRRELIVLVALPIGFLSGFGAKSIVGAMRFCQLISAIYYVRPHQMLMRLRSFAPKSVNSTLYWSGAGALINFVTRPSTKQAIDLPFLA
jgi:hypothetical protein